MSVARADDSTGPRGDRGFTLIELLIAIVLSTLIAGVVVAALITSLNVASSTTGQVSDSTDAGLISSFLTRDAQSAGAIVPTTALRDTTVGVSTDSTAAGWSGCTQTLGALVVRFSWIERTSVSEQSKVVVTYAFDSSNAQLTRRFCRDSTPGAELVLGRGLASVSATCDTMCTIAPTSVSLQVSGAGTRSPLDYTLKASLRGDTQTAPTVTNSPPVPLLALGAGGSVACPNLTLSGTGAITVRGNALVDGLCGSTPISGDQTKLQPTGTKTTIAGIVDPFLSRVPPVFSCPASGVNPATIGLSANRDIITVYPQAVSITTGTVLFQPGRYVFCNGLSITGGQVTGTDVLLYVNGGSVTVNAAATVDLRGRATGIDANLVIWVAKQNPQTLQIDGGSHVSSLRGVIYAPTSTLRLSSVKAANIGGIVVKDITIAGAGAARIGLPLPVMTISPLTIPAGLLGVPYSTTLTATGGTGTNTWSWTSATGLPPGLNISPTGVISGTPTVGGIFTVTVTVFDSTQEAASMDYTLSITNPAPVAVADSYATPEDTPLSPAAPGLLANDTDPRSFPLTAVLVSGVANGTLTLGSNGSFTYTPSANFNGIDSFTYKANNGSLDSNVVTVSLTVTAVNDAPVNSVPGPQETPKDANKVFSAANNNAISISDVDAGAFVVQVTLTATNGTITLPVLTGLTFSAGDGTADSTMTFTGTIANINLRLAGVTFAPYSGFSGAATLTIITNDQGRTGSGGTLTDTDAVGIYVNPLGIFTGFVDVPATGRPGSSTYSASTYTLTAGKGSIGGTSDEFQFLYRSMTGDGRLTARVVSVVGNDAGAQAGVMFRETLDPGSIHGTMDITRSNGWEFLDRQLTNQTTTTSQGAGPTAPYWVRLTRVGNLVTGERSVDGVTWVVSSSKTITMTPTIYIGLAVSSHNNSNNLSTGTFDNVTVTP